MSCNIWSCNMPLALVKASGDFALPWHTFPGKCIHSIQSLLRGLDNFNHSNNSVWSLSSNFAFCFRWEWWPLKWQCTSTIEWAQVVWRAWQWWWAYAKAYSTPDMMPIAFTSGYETARECIFHLSWKGGEPRWSFKIIMLVVISGDLHTKRLMN